MLGHCHRLEGPARSRGTRRSTSSMSVLTSLGEETVARVSRSRSPPERCEALRAPEPRDRRVVAKLARRRPIRVLSNCHERYRVFLAPRFRVPLHAGRAYR